MMKISCAALLLTAGSANAFDKMERKLESCPAPSSEVACTMNLDPVKCSLSLCPYDNLCLAGAAGYVSSRCWPATCKAPAETACTLEENPVLCGDQRCEYANLCIAGAAGFPPTVCAAKNCPQGEGACTMELDPHVCPGEPGLCYYDNGCLADLAGFDPSETAGQCFRLFELPPNKGGCPVVPEGTACTFDYDPALCGADKCYYTNSCEYTAAGFTADQCSSADCPAPDGATPCTADENPVICQPENCEYANQCTANAAGYSESTCRLASCAAPDLSATCDRSYNPQQCDGQCVYDNECLAESAGYTLDQCISLIEDRQPDGCAEVPADTACSQEFNELRCGTNGCQYSNACLANAAGFDESVCWGATCQAPSDVASCDSGDTDHVTCGPYACFYGNRCLANRAGWAPSECTPVSCPAGDETVACTLEYDPIICNSKLVSGGITCAYSNSCLASAAGYVPDAYAGQCVRVTTLPTSAARLENSGAETTGEVPETQSNAESSESSSSSTLVNGAGSFVFAFMAAFFV